MVSPCPSGGRCPHFARALIAVPAVGVVHVRPGAENPVRSTQQHHGEIVVFGYPVQAAGEGVTHGGVVGVALFGVVQRDRGDAFFGFDFEQHPII